jgi:TPR repeat protein
MSVASDRRYDRILGLLQKHTDFGRLADACHEVARKKEKGNLPMDHTPSLRCYRRAAELGHSGAQMRLGTMYAKGVGVAQDIGEAVKWYAKAAEQEHRGAQLALERIIGE